MNEKQPNTETIEDQAQVDALAEFAPRVREILREFRDERQLATIAKQLGFHQSRLTEMITKNSQGEYKTRITPYYLARFIEGGIMSVDQILGDRRLEDLPKRPRMFFERMTVPQTTLRLVIEAQKRGINVERILHIMLHPEEEEND